MKRPTRSGLAALVPLAVAGALAACSGPPVGTDAPYDPSDGVSASVGEISARNLLVVGSDAGAPGLVSGVLLNASDAVITVSLSSGAAAAVTVQVPAQGSVLLGAATGEPGASPPGATTGAVVQFDALPQPAGAVLPLNLSTPGGGTTTVQVPVLPATREYASITPTPAPLTPS